MRIFGAEFLAAICAAFVLNFYFNDKPQEPAPSQPAVQVEQHVPIKQEVAVKRTTPAENKQFHGEGQFKVGIDIPAGEYLAVGTGYVEVAKNSSGDANNILVNDNIIDAQRYLVVSDGEYVKVMGNLKLYLASDAPKLNTANGLPAGQYKVGVDIPAGEYKITLEAGGYIAVTRDTRRSYVKTQFTNAGGQFYATVADGQYLQIKNGEGHFVEAVKQ